MILFADSMERMSVVADMLKKWSSYVTTPTFNTTGGPSNGPYFNTTATANNGPICRIRAAGGSAVTTTRLAFWFRINGNPSSTDSNTNRNFVLLGDDTASAFAPICITTAGRIVVYASALSTGQTALSTGTTTVTDGSWHHLELKWTDGSSGSVTVFLDGLSEISYSGNTRYLTAGTNALLKAETIRFFGATGVGGGIDFADVVVWDETSGGLTGQMGVHEIDSFAPNAAGDSTQFTPSTGSNYQCVDETVANADTDYVSDNTSGHIDLYNFENLSITPTTIYSVVVNTVVASTTAGSISFRAKAKGGSTTVNGSTVAIAGLNYRTVQSEFSTDPNTSAAWTKAGYDAAQFGLEII